MADAAHVTGSESDVARHGEREQTSLRELIESLLVTIILALFGTTFVVQAFKIPSQSMEPTLLVGDHLLVNKFIFGGRDHWYDFVLPYRDVKRHDVIVFKFPFDDHPHTKRHGLPGGDRSIEARGGFGSGLGRVHSVFAPLHHDVVKRVLHVRREVRNFVEFFVVRFVFGE